LPAPSDRLRGVRRPDLLGRCSGRADYGGDEVVVAEPNHPMGVQPSDLQFGRLGPNADGVPVPDVNGSRKLTPEAADAAGEHQLD